MSRRLLSTAAALMLAGGVYLSAGTAEASNMGFKLERSFSFVTGAQNLYLVSFPLFPGLGDVSDGAGCSDAGESCRGGHCIENLCRSLCCTDDDCVSPRRCLPRTTDEGVLAPVCANPETE